MILRRGSRWWTSSKREVRLACLDRGIMGLSLWWWGTTPMKKEDRDRFSNDMDRILDSVRNEYRSYILRNLNGWIGDRTRAGIKRVFGVSGKNDNGRRVVVLRRKGTVWATH